MKINLIIVFRKARNDLQECAIKSSGFQFKKLKVTFM